MRIKISAEVVHNKFVKKVVRVNEVLCEGCGACIASCPTGAIQQRNFADEQFIRMINVIVGTKMYDLQHTLWTFKSGSDGVLVGSCHPSNCHYKNRDYKTLRGDESLKKAFKGFWYKRSDKV